MSDKKPTRLFPMPCCKLWKSFVFDDFTPEGTMILVCHKHQEPITQYITWRSGVEKEDFDKVIEEHKKKKQVNK